MRKPPAPLDTHPVRTPQQLRALASSVRQDIVDMVQALGRASVPEIAAELQRAPDALYYHVRLLVKVGLLVVVEQRRSGRHVEQVYATQAPERRLQLHYRPGRSAATAALRKVVTGMLGVARREFDAAIAREDCVVEGPRRELWAGRAAGWLSAAELERCNALLTELIALLSSPRSPARTRLFSLQFVLAPASRRGGGRTATDGRRRQR